MEKPLKTLVVDDERDVEMPFRLKFRNEIRGGQIELVFAFSCDESIKILNSTHPPEVG